MEKMCLPNFVLKAETVKQKEKKIFSSDPYDWK